MKTVTILRNYKPYQTRGILLIHENNLLVWQCYTLERPWKRNEKLISCIPAGKYSCFLRWSPRFKTDLFEVEKVENRTGILFHAGNYAGDVLNDTSGCILLGDSFKDLNGDVTYDIANSKQTLKIFMEIMGVESFRILISEL